MPGNKSICLGCDWPLVIHKSICCTYSTEITIKQTQWNHTLFNKDTSNTPVFVLMSYLLCNLCFNKEIREEKKNFTRFFFICIKASTHVWPGLFQTQSLLRLLSLSSRSASASAKAAWGSAFLPLATDRLPPIEGRPMRTERRHIDNVHIQLTINILYGCFFFFIYSFKLILTLIYSTKIEGSDIANVPSVRMNDITQSNVDQAG